MSELDRMEDAFQREIDRYEKEITHLRAKHTAFRSKVEQVRDEIRNRPIRFGVKYRAKDELIKIADTLTRILDEDGGRDEDAVAAKALERIGEEIQGGD